MPCTGGAPRRHKAKFEEGAARRATSSRSAWEIRKGRETVATSAPKMGHKGTGATGPWGRPRRTRPSNTAGDGVLRSRGPWWQQDIAMTAPEGRQQRENQYRREPRRGHRRTVSVGVLQEVGNAPKIIGANAQVTSAATDRQHQLNASAESKIWATAESQLKRRPHGRWARDHRRRAAASASIGRAGRWRRPGPRYAVVGGHS